MASRSLLALSLLSAVLFGSPASAQQSRADTSVATGKLPDDPHDLSGVWMNDDTLDERLKAAGLKRLDPNAPPPPPAGNPAANLTPEYRRIYDAEQARLAKLAEGTSACGWIGMPRIMTYPYPFEILQSPGRITIIYEAESEVRRVYLDRAEHLPADELDPSYHGDSIGRWDGNTLVIDTVGFNTQTLVGRLPHSESMHIVERWRYIDQDTVNVDVTITDPQAFKEPITQVLKYSKRPDWQIREYHCEENNRDAPDANGERSGGLAGSGK